MSLPTVRDGERDAILREQTVRLQMMKIALFHNRGSQTSPSVKGVKSSAKSRSLNILAGYLLDWRGRVTTLESRPDASLKRQSTCGRIPFNKILLYTFVAMDMREMPL